MSRSPPMDLVLGRIVVNVIVSVVSVLTVATRRLRILENPKDSPTPPPPPRRLKVARLCRVGSHDPSPAGTTITRAPIISDIGSHGGGLGNRHLVLPIVHRGGSPESSGFEFLLLRQRRWRFALWNGPTVELVRVFDQSATVTGTARAGIGCHVNVHDDNERRGKRFVLVGDPHSARHQFGTRSTHETATLLYWTPTRRFARGLDARCLQPTTRRKGVAVLLVVHGTGRSFGAHSFCPGERPTLPERCSVENRHVAHSIVFLGQVRGLPVARHGSPVSTRVVLGCPLESRFDDPDRRVRRRIVLEACVQGHETQRQPRLVGIGQ
mmetsp:Transcript_13696/g.30030  ORF Transcript_13696/g.30030 Transcript_13696/m.30030 type:complete len:324 (-) Transcript_13696:1154-2125(-)